MGLTQREVSGGDRARGTEPLGETATQTRVGPRGGAHERLLVDQEELSIPQLRAMIQALLQEASRAELQLAYKLLKGLLR
jgi:hypothetical protein